MRIKVSSASVSDRGRAGGLGSGGCRFESIAGHQGRPARQLDDVPRRRAPLRVSGGPAGRRQARRRLVEPAERSRVRPAARHRQHGDRGHRARHRLRAQPDDREGPLGRARRCRAAAALPAVREPQSARHHEHADLLPRPGLRGSPGRPDQAQLFGIDPASGRVRYRRSVPSPDHRPFYDQQRSALAAGNGLIYVAFGGHFGDCGPYVGSVVGVPAAGPHAGSRPIVSYKVPSSDHAGIWAPAAPPSTGRERCSSGSATATPRRRSTILTRLPHSRRSCGGPACSRHQAGSTTTAMTWISGR